MIEFKPLHKDDLRLLYRWFQEPTINQQYARGQTWSLKDIEIKYFPRLNGYDNVKCPPLSRPRSLKYFGAFSPFKN